MVGHGHVTTLFFASHSARTFLKHDHPRPFRWAWCRFPISRPRCKMSVQGVRKAPEELTNVRQLHILMSCPWLFRKNILHHDHVQKNEDSSSKPQQPFTWTLDHIAPDGIFVSLRHVAEAVLDLRVLRHQHPRVRRISPKLVTTNGVTHGEQRLMTECCRAIGLSLIRVTFPPNRCTIVAKC